MVIIFTVVCNTSEPCVLATFSLCYTRFSELSSIISLNELKLFIFVMDTDCILFEVRSYTRIALLSRQTFLGFPQSSSKYWDGSHVSDCYCMLLLQPCSSQVSSCYCMLLLQPCSSQVSSCYCMLLLQLWSSQVSGCYCMLLLQPCSSQVSSCYCMLLLQPCRFNSIQINPPAVKTVVFIHTIHIRIKY